MQLFKLFLIFQIPFVAQAGRLVIPVPKITWETNINRVEDMYNYTVMKQLYRGLFRSSADGKIEPDLVESTTVSKDKKIWKFTLKKAFFSDGTSISSKHVVNTFVRIFTSGASIAADLSYIENSKKVNEMDIKSFGVKSISEREVQFNLIRPSALFLHHLATTDTGILNLTSASVSAVPSGFSGAYKIENTNSTSMLLKKWQVGIFDSKLPPKELLFKKIDIVNSNEAIKAGVDTIDFITVDKDTRSKLKKDGWIESVTETAKTWFVLASPDKVSSDLRRALLSKINRESIIKSLNNAFMIPLYGVIPPVLSGSISKNDYKASTLPTFDHKIELTLEYAKDSSIAEVIANFLRKMWSNSNIKVRLLPLTQEEYFKKLFNKEAALILASKVPDYHDGYSELSYFRQGIKGNYFTTANPKFNSLLDLAVQDFDINSRIRKYKELQNIILSEATFMPICTGSSASGLWSSKVKRVPPHPLGIHGIPMESIEVSE